MTSITLDDVQRAARDSFYVSIGLGVIAFQKAQVQRQELRKSLTNNLAEARTTLEASLKTAEERLGDAEERLDAVLDDVEAQLPESARTVMSQARKAAKDARAQIQGVIGIS